MRQMERPEVFYTYEWALAVARSHRASITPLLLSAYEGSAVVGVAALATNRDEAEACFLAGTTADYCDFVSAPVHRAELTNAVLAELRRLKMRKLVFANLPADSATSGTLAETSREHGYFLFSRPAYRCAHVSFASEEEREAVRRTVRGKPMVRRHLAEMNRRGPVTLSHLKSSDQIAQSLPPFVEAHINRFLSTGRISHLVFPERRKFLLQLAEQLSPSGWLVLTRLMVGDQPVAWNYGFQFEGNWFWYQPTFDGRWQQYSPGFCLLSKIVEEACNTTDLTRVDLGLGEEGYKERLATGNRQTLHMTATASWSGFARAAARYHTATAAKTAPRVESSLRLVRSNASALRKYFRNSHSLNFAGGLWARCRDAVFGRQEVLFFEWPENQVPAGANRGVGSLSIRPLSPELLAVAAMRYSDDQVTLAYVLRAARRFASGETKGLVLCDTAGVPLHFCWVAPVDGFFMSELNHTLNSSWPEAVLLFDCWTPSSVRGRGYYAQAISLVATELQASGKRPWIFSAAANRASLRGVARAGFVNRFSLLRKRAWFIPRVVALRPRATFQLPPRVASAA